MVVHRQHCSAQTDNLSIPTEIHEAHLRQLLSSSCMVCSRIVVKLLTLFLVADAM